jgi:hypothetical protein
MRMLLQTAGLGRISQKAMDEYRPTIKSAFREFINRQILQRLDIPKPEAAQAGPPSASAPIEAPPTKADDRTLTTEAELAVFQWTQQRLAYLVDDDSLFSEIKNIQYKDYQGKFVVFYKMERKGRLFEFHEQKGNGAYRFVFPDDAGIENVDKIVAALPDIDDALLATFRQRVQGGKPGANGGSGLRG